MALYPGPSQTFPLTRVLCDEESIPITITSPSNALELAIRRADNRQVFIAHWRAVKGLHFVYNFTVFPAALSSDLY